MAVTQNSYIGNGTTTTYAFTFPYLKSADIKAQINASEETGFTLPTATTLQFNTAPSNGDKIKIYRKTDDESLTATFYAGSSLKSEDLNDNFTQNLYTTQEVNARYLSNLGGTMVGDLTMGEDAVIVFEGATDNAHETTLTVADPTADRTVTLPNETGTVLTTGSSGVVSSAMIADGTIVNADIANTTITGAKLVNDTITATQIAADAVGSSELANNAVDSNAIATDAVNGGKIADNSIDSEHYVDGSIDAVHLASGTITATQLAADSVGASELANDSVASANIIAGSIVNADLNASAGIVGTKLANDTITATQIAADAVGSSELANNAVDTAAIQDDAVNNDKIATNAVNGDSIAADAVTGSHIGDDQINSEHYAADSIDTEHYAPNSVDNTALGADCVSGANIADNAIGAEHIAANAVTTSEIADAELTTLAGMQSATASILAAGTDLTATLAEINSVVDGKAPQTTITDDDTKYPTSGAVVDYVAAQIAPIGGLEVIATDAAFPNTQPASGVVISISDAGGVVFNGSGSSTTGRTVGSSTVTINNAPSSLNSETLAAGVGLMVSSTGAGQIYNYHKILGKEDDIKQLSDDINDFNARYRVNAGEPSSNNDEGDLCYDTNADTMKVYDSTTSAWKEVTSTGDFKFLVPVDAGTTTAATFDGSDTSFDLKESTNSGSAANVTSVFQLIVSLNGIIQKPNSGSWSGSGEGFYLTDADTIRFATAPSTGSTCFIIQCGSAVSIPTPGDNTVSTAKIQNLAVDNARIANDTISEAKLDIHQAPSDGKFLKYTSSNGMEWGDVPAGVGGATGVDFDDNVKIRLGTGNDVEIYHDATGGGYSYIMNNGPALIKIGSDTNIVLGKTSNENYFIGKPDGAVELYYDNVKKLETTSAGVTVTGDLTFSDSSSNDIILQGGKIYGETAATGALTIQSTNGNANHAAIIVGENYGSDNGGITFYGAGSSAADVKMRIRGTTDNIEIPDSHKLNFGDSNDLQLYHDGTDNYLYSNDKTLYINANSSGSAKIQIAAINAEKNADFLPNGAVELYYDSAKKFETTSTGVAITGGFTTSGGSAFNSTISFNDDASFYGANYHIYFDKSANALEFQDSAKATFGTDNDLQIYHNGTASFLDEVGDGGIYISTELFTVRDITSNEPMIVATGDGGVQLYYDNTLTCYTSNSCLSFPDSQKIFMGGGNDLQIWHDPSNDDSKISHSNASGILKIESSDLGIELNTSDGHKGIKVQNNSSVQLYYDNSNKAETAAGGWYVHGSQHTNGGHLPWNDDQFDLGGSSERWDDVYASNGTIQTSDRTTKDNITSTDLGLTFVNKLNPVSYKFKGKTRTHYGLIAQDVETVLSDISKPTSGFAGFIKDTVTKDSKTQDDLDTPITSYGLRYTEFIAPLIKAVQELSSEVETLKTKVAALEAK